MRDAVWKLHPDWDDLGGGLRVLTGGAGPVVLDLPGSTPSELVFIGGKEGIVYLLDRCVLGPPPPPAPPRPPACPRASVQFWKASTSVAGRGI